MRKILGKCAIDGCEVQAVARSLCMNHYYRFRHDPGISKGEHILLAEKALGKPLPKGAVVHHMNGKRSDNHTPFNLVICPDQAYHMLLHKREKDLRSREFFAQFLARP